MQRTYGIADWDTPEEFLEKYARKAGKLLKGGEANMRLVGRMVITDWIRGRIPWFVMPQLDERPPKESDALSAAQAAKEEAADETPEAKERKAVEKKVEVKQMFSKIPVMQKFEAEDLEGDEELKVIERAEAAKDLAAKVEGRKKTVTDWDEVFSEVKGEVVKGKGPAIPIILEDDEDEEESDDDDEEELDFEALLKEGVLDPSGNEIASVKKTSLKRKKPVEGMITFNSPIRRGYSLELV